MNNKIPKNLTSYKTLNKNLYYVLLATGAPTIKNSKKYGIVFDKYDDDGNHIY